MAKSCTFSRIKSPGSAIKASGLFQENEKWPVLHFKKWTDHSGSKNNDWGTTAIAGGRLRIT